MTGLSRRTILGATMLLTGCDTPSSADSAIAVTAAPGSRSGSAIFLHVMRREAGRALATAGCVSLARADLLAVQALCGPRSSIRIGTI